MITGINAGKLDKRIQLQEDQGTTPDANGHATPAWTTIDTVWGAVEPLSGREYWQAQQVNSEVTHKVTIRYRAGLTSKMRVKHSNRYLNIASIINPEERNIELVLMCQEAA